MVDTLYDGPRTDAMLRAYRDASGLKSFERVVNTHANGDHCYGNGRVKGARFIASQACADEMSLLPPSKMNAFMKLSRAVTQVGAPARGFASVLSSVGLKTPAAFLRAGPFVHEAFSAFDFDGSELVVPGDTFSGTRTERVGEHTVELVEVGPAHTRGDVLVFVPEQKVVFTGDILFNRAHPVMWEGPVQNWIAAFDTLLARDVDVIVPGHGPLATRADVERARQYFITLRDEAKKRFDAGVPAKVAAEDIALAAFDDWGESERIFPNVMTLYRDFAGERHAPHMAHLFAGMQRRRERGLQRKGS